MDSRSAQSLAIIGLGNEYLSDDGAGIAVVRELRQTASCTEGVAFAELAVGGLLLLDHIVGHDRCIIIDAMVTGKQPPGTIWRTVLPTQPPAPPLRTSHQVDLSQVCSLGKLLGAKIPHPVIVYGIEAGDVKTFGTKCTERVRDAIPRLVAHLQKALFAPDLPPAPPEAGADGVVWEILHD